jgi:hypothetical protein
MEQANRVVILARQATQIGRIGSLESILGLLKSLKIRGLCWKVDREWTVDTPLLTEPNTTLIKQKNIRPLL